MTRSRGGTLEEACHLANEDFESAGRWTETSLCRGGGTQRDEPVFPIAREAFGRHRMKISSRTGPDCAPWPRSACPARMEIEGASHTASRCCHPGRQGRCARCEEMCMRPSRHQISGRPVWAPWQGMRAPCRHVTRHPRAFSTMPGDGASRWRHLRGWDSDGSFSPPLAARSCLVLAVICARP